MRFASDLQTPENPVARASRAIGSHPVQTSGRWPSTGVEIAHWRVAGPHQFTYGEQACHCITFVHGPLSNHLLIRNNKIVRQGRVDADRFRLSSPGDEIGAQVTSSDPILMTHLYFSNAALENLAEDLALPEAPIRLLDPSWDRRSEEIETIIRLLYRDVGTIPSPDWARLEFLALYAVSTILRDGTSAPAPRAAARATSKRVGRAVQFINDNLSRQIGLADIACAACLSPFHLCRVFREEMGTTPHAFLQHRRVSEAKRLLQETSFGLDEIAFRTGFASAGSLAGALRRRYGTGPTKIRRG